MSGEKGVTGEGDKEIVQLTVTLVTEKDEISQHCIVPKSHFTPLIPNPLYTRGQVQGNRTRRVRQVCSKLDVSTSLTPSPRHLLSFNLMCYVKQVGKRSHAQS